MRMVGPEKGEPPCHHVETTDRLHPHSPTCAECVAIGVDWVGLLVCLACGWVACSDESTNRHALAHYEETDHPVVASYQPSDWRWCYVHRRVV